MNSVWRSSSKSSTDDDEGNVAKKVYSVLNRDNYVNHFGLGFCTWRILTSEHGPHRMFFFNYGSGVIFSNNHSIPKSRLNRSNCDLSNGDKNLLAAKPKSKFVKKKN